MFPFSSHRWLFVSTLLFVAALPGSLHAQAITFEQALDELIQEALKTWEVPGAAVAIVQQEKILYLKGFGVCRQGGKEPVTPETLFALSSCTKAFTALAVALLVEDGKLGWDDPVRQHVPFFRLADPAADAQVTLRDLLCHRTGVGTHDLLFYRTPWSQDEQIRRIGRVQPSYPFRAGFQYQNLMYTAVGYAVGTTSGMPWGDFVQQRILVPLGMNATRCTNTDILNGGKYAAGHRRHREGRIEPIPWYRFDEPNAALSISSNARDLARWLQFQLGDGTFQGRRLLSPRNLLEPRLPQTIIRLEGVTQQTHPFTAQMSYGMGWVIQDYRGLLLNSHGGLVDGQRAHITLIPSQRVGLAILANLHATRMNLALSNLIVDRLFGFPFKDWHRHYQELVQAEEAAEQASRQQRHKQRQPDTQPSHPLHAYTGTYEEPAYGTARVTLENDGLMWHWSTWRCPLEHFHYDTFTIREELLKEPLLVFTLGADGTVSGFRWHELTFKKIGQ